MQLVVLADEILKKELLDQGTKQGLELTWIANEKEFIHHQSADGFIDLLFEDSHPRIELLRTLSSKPVVINSVIPTLKEMNSPFVRINGWPGFLARGVAEASCDDENIKQQAEEIFFSINRKAEWVSDEPGFITGKIVSMIINEAYFALEEKVSSKDEIDTAMKLGTNYPYGPFEWSRRIGLKNIYELLNNLSKTGSRRYQPANLLAKEAME